MIKIGLKKYDELILEVTDEYGEIKDIVTIYVNESHEINVA